MNNISVFCFNKQNKHFYVACNIPADESNTEQLIYILSRVSGDVLAIVTYSVFKEHFETCSDIDDKLFITFAEKCQDFIDKHKDEDALNLSIETLEAVNTNDEEVLSSTDERYVYENRYNSFIKKFKKTVIGKYLYANPKIHNFITYKEIEHIYIYVDNVGFKYVDDVPFLYISGESLAYEYNIKTDKLEISQHYDDLIIAPIDDFMLDYSGDKHPWNIVSSISVAFDIRDLMQKYTDDIIKKFINVSKNEEEN